jgi:hypothetical protein
VGIMRAPIGREAARMRLRSLPGLLSPWSARYPLSEIGSRAPIPYQGRLTGSIGHAASILPVLPSLHAETECLFVGTCGGDEWQGRS